MERFSRRSQFIVSTFNPELLEYANGLIGVTYDQKGQVCLIFFFTFLLKDLPMYLICIDKSHH